MDEKRLPGGLQGEGVNRRFFAFKSVTGALELALAECADRTEPLATRVTQALLAALSEIGGQNPTWEMIHGLSVGDRQFLMRQLGAHMGLDGIWLTAVCNACDERFDVYVEQSSLPVKPAGSGYPFAEADTSLGRLRFRVPSGADQEALEHCEDEASGVRRLVARLCIGEPSTADTLDGLDTEDLARIDVALEAVAPEVTTWLQANCPQCGDINRVEVDPYASLSAEGETLFTEIHQLASIYHWSESEILALPRERRKLYLRLIDRSRGMSG